MIVDTFEMMTQQILLTKSWQSLEIVMRKLELIMVQHKVGVGELRLVVINVNSGGGIGVDHRYI